MPVSGTVFKNKELPLVGVYNSGLMSLLESNVNSLGGGNFGMRAAGYFSVSTGTALVPDVTYNQSSAVQLLPDAAVPEGCRCYVTRLDIDVQGKTSWASSGQSWLQLQDSLGYPGVYLPFNALRGYSAYTFPDSDTEVPMSLSPTSYSFNSSTGVGTATFAASTFAGTNTMVGIPFTVVAGTGQYTTGVILSNTTTTITWGTTSAPAPGTGGIDTTSVFAIWYWNATSGTSSTVLFSYAPAGFAGSNVLDNGFNVISVLGTSVGQVRPISASSTTGGATLTVPYNFNATPASGDLIHVSNESNLYGSLDLFIAEKWPVLSLNKGLQLAIGGAGTPSAGSAVRAYAEGFFAA